MPEISCPVLSFVCCCLVCHCLEKFQFQPRSIRFDFKFNVCNGWTFQNQKVGGSSPVRSELHYISSRTLTLGITNNCKYFIHLFIFHVTFSSSRFWVHENSVVSGLLHFCSNLIKNSPWTFDKLFWDITHLMSKL